MHTILKKEKNYKKEKPRYSDLFLVTATQNNTKTAPEIQLHHNRRLQEGNRAQAPLSPDQRY
jgi:hypothetical protein